MLILTNGPLKLDIDCRQVWLADEEIKLSRTAFNFLAAMMTTKRGIAVSREELLKDVWEVQEPQCLETRLIDAMVYRLVKKLGEGWFQPVPGYGYRFLGKEQTRIVTEEEQVA